MKKIVLIMASLGLASCDGIHDLQDVERQMQSNAVASHQGGPSGALSVITEKSVPAYYADLTRCESRASASMGPPGPSDSMEALRRALNEHPGQKTISLSYVNQDKAIVRQKAIKSCLSRLGYLVE